MNNEIEPGKKGDSTWLGVGAVGAAILASSCCILPLLLGGAGVSALGLAASFETARPYLLGVTALLLGGGFYYNYFRKPDCAPGEACEVPRPRLQRFNRTVLWFATAAVVAFALFPSYATIFTKGEAPPAASFGSVSSEQIVLEVSGMTCEACAVGIQRELAGVPGVLRAEVDFVSKQALVVIQADPRPDDTELLSAVDRAGYSAVVTPSGDHKG